MPSAYRVPLASEVLPDPETPTIATMPAFATHCTDHSSTWFGLSPAIQWPPSELASGVSERRSSAISCSSS